MNRYGYAIYYVIARYTQTQCLYETDRNLRQYGIYIHIITSTSDLQPSTAVANQLPGHLVSTQLEL